MIKPLPGYCLISPIKEQETSEMGLLLPDKPNEKPARGKILSVGPDGVFEDGKPMRCPVKEGDTVYYRRWGGEDIQFQGKDYHFSKFTELIGVVE